MSIEEYRKLAKQKHEKVTLLAKIKDKYANLLDFNKERRSIYRIQNYIKRHLFKQPFNLMKEEIDDIPGIYRYRTIINSNEEEENINEMFNLYYLELENIEDPDIKKVQKMHIDEQKKDILSKMESISKKYPILIDLRIYGMEPNTPVYIDGKIYMLSEFDKINVKTIFDKINEHNLNGERYLQMLNWSKELCSIYRECLH